MKYSLLKGHLVFHNNYKWSLIHENDPRVSGPLSKTPFNPSEGYEVLYLINELMSIWKFDSEQYAIKLEKMIKCGITNKGMPQHEVRDWIKTHWLNY